MEDYRMPKLQIVDELSDVEKRGPGKMVFGMFMPDHVPVRAMTDREIGNSPFRIAAVAKAGRRAANKRARVARVDGRTPRKKLWGVEVCDSLIPMRSHSDAVKYVASCFEIMRTHAEQCSLGGRENLVEGLFEDAHVVEWPGGRRSHAQSLRHNPNGEI